MSELTHSIVSFDPASFKNLGWSLWSLDENQKISIKAGTLTLPSYSEPWMSLWPVFLFVDSMLTEHQPEVVIVEKTSSFAGGFITGQVSNCMGAILSCCGKHEVDVGFVFPTHVKKVVSGNGRATKTQMKNSVKKMVQNIAGLTIQFDSEHSCDATANVLCYIIDNGLFGDEDEATQ